MYLGDHLNSFMITPQIVLKKIMGLHPEKTPDGWHPVLLIDVADLINVPLARLFQKSLIDGVVPPQWLLASVTAIHKKGAKKHPRKLQTSKHYLYRWKIDGINCER